MRLLGTNFAAVLQTQTATQLTAQKPALLSCLHSACSSTSIYTLVAGNDKNRTYTPTTTRKERTLLHRCMQQHTTGAQQHPAFSTLPQQPSPGVRPKLAATSLCENRHTTKPVLRLCSTGVCRTTCRKRVELRGRCDAKLSRIGSCAWTVQRSAAAGQQWSLQPCQ
jgi:hypothetical protein